MKLLNIPFIFITISTGVGILLGYYYVDIAINALLPIFFISTCILSGTWQQSKKMFSKGHFFTFSMILFFIIFGITLVKIHNPKNQPNHYINHINISHKDPIGIRFHIKEHLKSSSYYNKYIISLRYLEEEMVDGLLLLRISKDSISPTLEIGDTYTIYTKIEQTPKPLNPLQFDYAKHLSKQYIYHQITAKYHQLIHNERKKSSLPQIAYQIRKNINLSLSSYSFTDKQLSIINALILGQKQNLSKETFDAYKDAGAIHILAVSGLHIGIILLFLNSITSPLNRYKRFGKTLQLILIILSLWSFAIIAGLSPSVLRAVTMFSFLSIGKHMRSKASTLSSLFISAFVLLCFNPLLLFSIGFQLSYLAVLAIILIQPLIAKFYAPRFYIFKKLWETFTVTIAAQIGLLPITLYYFNHFPILFFVSNLIIIPFLGSILGIGIIVIILASLHILPDFIRNLFSDCISTMNYIVAWTAQHENFIIRNIYFSKSMLFSFYLILVFAIATSKLHLRKRLIWLTAPILLFIGILIYEKHSKVAIEELIIYHTHRNTTIGFLKNQSLRVYSKTPLSKKNQTFLFGNYLTKKQASLDSTVRLKNKYQYKKQNIIIIDSSCTYNTQLYSPDILLLSGSPKIHLDRVLSILKPKQIIADGSNYKSYIDRWEISCKKQKIPFHRTDKKGAFVLK
ncbi:ComEC/Rec2 family competence protein [Aquimarina aquimarini]|uniref:ComEC/Rec2 family competence protein n=1 Tax=Aquimarina aquimarini TaxID=1191734 RepID=UPI000D555E03|nr:ComEC/Rec2 family competence protein [Aquimarina aquimarini]